MSLLVRCPTSAALPIASALAANLSELHAGECDTVSAELKEAQKAGAELMQDREELSAQLAGLEQQLADMTQARDDLKCACHCSYPCIAAHHETKLTQLCLCMLSRDRS